MSYNAINWPSLKKMIDNNSEVLYTPIFLQSKSEAIDLYFKIIQADISELDLGGIPTVHAMALQRIYVDGIDIPSHFLNIARIEPFLRKILFMVNHSEYTNQKSEKSGLAMLIKALGLNDDHIALENAYKEYSRSNFYFHLSTAYQLRNAESHYCSEIGTNKLNSLLDSVIIVYLRAIDINSKALKKWFDNNNKSLITYINSIKSDFKKWNQRFVPINGKEQFHEIALYAIEYKPQTSSNTDKLREGEIEKLRQDLITNKQNQMIIMGEAGIGKTTTMMYLAYKDAESGKIPIYIELKLLINGETLESVIKRKTQGLSESFNTIMQSSNTFIFLDGLNEILPSMKIQIYREIFSLINRYPNAFFMISSRPQNYDGEFGNIPSFILQKMDNSKICEFLKKNSDRKDVRDIILNAINTNEEWLKILGTPLILFMLIRVVSIENELPDDKNKIIIRFIKSLYNREKEKDYSFDRDYFHAILCHIAFECIDQIGNTNSGFSFNKAKDLLLGKVNIEDQSLMMILKKAVELNILVRDDNLYSFSHQSYQDTLAGDYFNTFLA